MTKEIGPKEKWLREMREQKYSKKPSPAELRKQMAKIKPPSKMRGGGRGR